jgi:hypothetical protein
VSPIIGQCSGGSCMRNPRRSRQLREYL